MNTIEDLMNMIAAEAAESIFESRIDSHGHKVVEENLPPIDYRLQLMKNEDGTYCWIED